MHRTQKPKRYTFTWDFSDTLCGYRNWNLGNLLSTQLHYKQPGTPSNTHTYYMYLLSRHVSVSQHFNESLKILILSLSRYVYCSFRSYTYFKHYRRHSNMTRHKSMPCQQVLYAQSRQCNVNLRNLITRVLYRYFDLSSSMI